MKRCGAFDLRANAPAPNRPIEGGLPTEALVADVLVSKYADHLPLYRQAQILTREGVHIDRSTLAHWVGFAAYELALHERLVAILKAAPKLFADETRCPVLDPGRGKTKTGYLCAPGWRRPSGGRLHVRARARRRARRSAARRLLRCTAGRRLRRIRQTGRRDTARWPAHACLLLEPLQAPLLRHRQNRERAHRQRRARAHQSALYNRSRDPWALRRQASRRAADTRTPSRRRAARLARRSAQARLRTLTHRRSHALRHEPLARPLPLPRRRSHRDRHERGRAFHPADRLEPQERAVRR